MKVAFKTLGCKLNQYEEYAIREKLENQGFEIVSFEEKADIYIINTCTVTAKADRNSRYYAYKAKRINPSSIVAFVGCYPQVFYKHLKDLNVELILGNYEKVKFLDYLQAYLDLKAGIKDKFLEIKKLYDKHSICTYVDGKLICVLNLVKNPCLIDISISDFKDFSRAFVKIQQGCDSYCAYCIIPFARGKPVSFPKEKILKEIKNLSKIFDEIILTGTELAKYGKDLYKNYFFKELLKDILEIPTLKKLRLSSLNVQDLDTETINLFKDEKICAHFHIPLQSGSDRILKLMKRKYDTSKYLETVSFIKEVKPHACIGADIITGFPTETPKDFEDTLKFLEKTPLNYLHVFTYSDRPGTLAYSLRPKVSPEDKKKRTQILRNFSKERKLKFIKENLGKTLEAILLTKEDKNYYYALTENYIDIKIPKEKDLSKFKRKLIKVIPLRIENEKEVIGKVLK